MFYVSNPTPLFNNPITEDEEYPMSKSIKLRVSNLNKDFKYFNLYVIKTIKGVRTPYLIETFEINSDNFSYIYTGINKNINQNVSIDEILSRRPHYTKAKSISESNGYLLLSSLSENRILNLQPVINKLPLSFIFLELFTRLRKSNSVKVMALKLTSPFILLIISAAIFLL